MPRWLGNWNSRNDSGKSPRTQNGRMSAESYFPEGLTTTIMKVSGFGRGRD
jgi:hypothetical protein